MPPKGWKPSEAIKKHMSEAHKGKKSTFLGKHHTSEAKEKNRIAHLGRHPSPETLEKMRIACNTPEAKERNRITHLGQYVSPETRDKLRNALLGRQRHPCSEETKKKIGDKSRGRHPSLETIEKMRVASTGKHPSPETIEKLRLVNIGKKRTSEAKEKNRIAHLRENLSIETLEKLRVAGLRENLSHEILEKHRVSHLRENLSPEAIEGNRIAHLRENLSPETLEKLHVSHLRENLSPETIEKMSMNAIQRVGHYPCKDTKIELTVQGMLVDLGKVKDRDFFTDYPILAICRPDIVLYPEKVVIQCDGDYWHGFKYYHLTNEEILKIQPKGRQEKGILNKMIIDRNQTTKLQEAGYIVLRFWEHDIEKRPEWVRAEIMKALSIPDLPDPLLYAQLSIETAQQVN
jgi:DNA mismatch endonuclease (patch repair protein)